MRIMTYCLLVMLALSACGGGGSEPANETTRQEPPPASGQPSGGEATQETGPIDRTVTGRDLFKMLRDPPNSGSRAVVSRTDPATFGDVALQFVNDVNRLDVVSERGDAPHAPGYFLANVQLRVFVREDPSGASMSISNISTDAGAENAGHAVAWGAWGGTGIAVLWDAPLPVGYVPDQGVWPVTLSYERVIRKDTTLATWTPSRSAPSYGPGDFAIRLMVRDFGEKGFGACWLMSMPKVDRDVCAVWDRDAKGALVFRGHYVREGAASNPSYPEQIFTTAGLLN